MGWEVSPRPRSASSEKAGQLQLTSQTLLTGEMRWDAARGGGLTCPLSDSWRSRLARPPLCDFWGSSLSWLDNWDSSRLRWFFSFLFWLFFSSPFRPPSAPPLLSCFGSLVSGAGENTSGFPVSLGRSDSSIRFFMGFTLRQEKRQRVRTEVTLPRQHLGHLSLSVRAGPWPTCLRCSVFSGTVYTCPLLSGKSQGASRMDVLDQQQKPCLLMD